MCFTLEFLSLLKYPGNRFRRSYEAERHFKKTHLGTDTRRSLAGLAGIKASGENTVRGDVQITLGQVLQLRDHWSGHRLPRVRHTLPTPRPGHGPPCSLDHLGALSLEQPVGSPAPGDAVAMTTEVSRGHCWAPPETVLFHFWWWSGLGQGSRSRSLTSPWDEGIPPPLPVSG